MESGRRFHTRLLEELRARKVFRVALTYGALAFAGLQAADVIITPLAGERVYRWVVIATLAGFPVAILLAWFFELRRNGTLVRATRPGAEETRGRPSRWYVAGIATLIVVGAGLYGYHRYGGAAKATTVAPGAEVIAVAPFASMGGGTAAGELGEGMAQLVSENLDQVGGLRTLDPGRVRRAWSESETEGRAEADALDLGRRLGAGSVLTGSVVAAGDEARLNAVLRAVGGHELARAQATGPASDVLLLADTLSNRLLRGVWRSHSPVPQLRIAAITTSNLDAIRAYLDGERYYRRLQWDSAIMALRRAVEADSTFALAHRRLADAYGWTSDMGSPLRTREEEAAARTPERLPDRERTIAVAYLLWSRDVDYHGALDSIDSHLRRYPDDAEALELRAEMLFHGSFEGYLQASDSAQLAAFEEALAVDPQLTPAMLHPIGLSAMLGDTARLRHYAGRLLNARLGAGVDVTPLVDSIAALVWGPDSVAARFAVRFATGPGLRTIGPGLMVFDVRLAIGLDPNPLADAMLQALDTIPDASGRAAPGPVYSPVTMASLASALTMVGRIPDAERALDRMSRSPEFAVPIRASAVSLGLASPDFFGRVWPEPETPATAGVPAGVQAAVQSLFDLGHGDTAAAARALAAARAAASTLPPAVDALRRFQEGRLRALRGDTDGGLKEMQAALDAVLVAPPKPAGFPPGPLRILLAIERAGHSATRQRGMEELRRHLDIPLLRLHLARALEADGQPQAALEQYAIFATQTRLAEGPLARMNAEARAAIARLARER